MYEIKSEFYDFLMIDIIYLKFVIFGFFYVMILDDFEYMNYYIKLIMISFIEEFIFCCWYLR